MSGKGLSESPDSSKSSLTLSQAQYLKKAEIIAELRARGIAVDEEELRDDLRKKLVDLVKLETAETNTANTVEDDQDGTSGFETDGRNANAGTPESESSEDDMPGDTKIFFRLDSDDWEAFTEWLELHFLVKKITTPELKRAHLLKSCDEETYKLFRNLCAPEKPAAKSYEDLVKLLNEHLKPAPSEVMERCTFNRAKQEQSEKVADFATRLRRLAINCKFTDLNNALRDQFVCGILNDSIRVDLFKLTELTFDKALKEATARESGSNKKSCK